MKKHIQPLPDHRKPTITAYITGFVLSLTLSGAAFALVWAYHISDNELMSRGLLLAILTLFAIAQIVVQATYFLHMSAERRARMTLVSAAFTLVVIFAIIVGSMWIMYNLDYNMIPEDPTQYIQNEENIHVTSQ